MPIDYSRTDRINSSIHKALARIIRDEIKDPRVGMVTIQEVRTVRDLSQAKIYFTLMNDDDAKQVGKILQNAAGFIRRQLGREVQLRTVPELKFVYDTSVEYGNRLRSLLEETVRADAEKHPDSED